MRVANSILHLGGIAIAAIMLSAPMATTALAGAGTGLPDAQLQFAQTQLRMGNQNMQSCLNNCDQQTTTCYRNAQGRAKEDCENDGTQCKRNCQ
jgi:hypothetical protein